MVVVNVTRKARAVSAGFLMLSASMVTAEELPRPMHSVLERPVAQDELDFTPVSESDLVPVEQGLSADAVSATMPGTQPVKVACQAPVAAEVYAVTKLEQCGTALPNSRLLGVINRLRPCATETLVAEVFADPRTCEDCAAASAVARLRAQRQVCSCANPQYLTALVQDLAAYSGRVRRAATRSLRSCGLRVIKQDACVQADVPLVVFYQ